MNYNGWKWWNTIFGTAPNFGGIETWVEVEFRKDGKKVFAAGTTVENAEQNAHYKIDRKENPVSESPEVCDSRIPF